MKQSIERLVYNPKKGSQNYAPQNISTKYYRFVGFRRAA